MRSSSTRAGAGTAFRRHKGKLALITLMTWSAAALVYAFTTPFYVSEAKLMIKYIIDRDARDARDTFDSRQNSVMEAELKILTSRDLYKRVVADVGADRLLTGGGRAEPVSIVAQGLTASVTKGSNVIHLTFKHRDPESAQATLNSVIRNYIISHQEFHRGGATPEIVAEPAVTPPALISNSAMFAGRFADAEASRKQAGRRPAKSWQNIAILQHPAPGIQDTKQRNRFLAAMIAGAPVLGALAVLVWGRQRVPSPAGESPACA